MHLEGDSGNTKQTVVTTMIGLREGSIIDLRVLESSERRLRASQIFETNPALGNHLASKYGNPIVWKWKKSYRLHCHAESTFVIAWL